MNAETAITRFPLRPPLPPECWDENMVAFVVTEMVSLFAK